VSRWELQSAKQDSPAVGFGARESLRGLTEKCLVVVRVNPRESAVVSCLLEAIDEFGRGECGEEDG
jgi:hypothetical protein